MILNLNEISDINTALSGWKSNPDLLAPCYYPSKEHCKAILDFIKQSKSLSENTFKSIQQYKTRAENFQSFIVEAQIQPGQCFKQDCIEFIDTLKTEIQNINKILMGLGFTDEETEIYNAFIARTSPILFYMGFADAISHASQVSRKCIVEAYKRKSIKPELLQVAMVGWIHDPKVPLKFSWSNLTTHPVIASAIAFQVLNEPDLRTNLAKYLAGYKDYVSVDYYINTIVEALAVNNDSEYVLKNGILSRPIWAPGPSEPGGVLNQVLLMSDDHLKSLGINEPAEKLAEKLESDAVYWFESSVVKNKKLEADEQTKTLLRNIKLETGLKGLYKGYFADVQSRLSSEYNKYASLLPEDLFNQILDGFIDDKDFIKYFAKEIMENEEITKKAFYTPVVNGMSLFSHFIGVENITIAALALEIADPLLLSPQKLMAEGVKDTVMEQIKDFMRSFSQNIKYLPQEAQNDGKLWQRDLYYSIVMAADELTRQNTLASFEEENTDQEPLYKPFKTRFLPYMDIRIIEKQVKLLETIIQKDSTWNNPNLDRMFASMERKKPENKEEIELIIDTLKKYYDLAIEKSPEMFALLAFANNS